MDSVDIIKSTFDKLKSQNEQLNSIFVELNKIGNPIIIGGALRNILDGKKLFRDIDIIIELNNNRTLTSFFIQKGIKFNQNRFGGYKFKIVGINFDLWDINDHWAFKKKLYNKSVKNIEKTTFFNYDSIVYEIKSNTLFSEKYGDCLCSKVLDIIEEDDYIEKNPSPAVNIVRAFKLSREKGYKFSPKLKKYILNYYKKSNNYENELKVAYKKHYGIELNDSENSFILLTTKHIIDQY